MDLASLQITPDQSSVPALAQRYAQVRTLSRGLAAPLSPEDCQVQSMPDCSPIKWHLAHTTWFFETFILTKFSPDYRAFHPQYRMLFNSYYNAVGEKHPRAQRGMLTRPTLADVLRYREHVDGAMAALLRPAHRLEAACLDLVELGLNHEQQHQELILTDIKHALSLNPLRPAYAQPPTTSAAPRGAVPAGYTHYQGGCVRIGHEPPGFAFDNEGPCHDVLLRPFALANRLVTQGEYLEFMRDGGYERPELWLSMGWDRVCAEQWQAPLYWEHDDHGWHAFTLGGMQPLDPEAPVTHVSYFEADAYARWAQARLPREAEWEHAARAAAKDAPANLLDQGYLQPRPAAQRTAAGGPAQLFGDTWEWTSSAYDAYPGYAPAPGAVGEYNGKFMCNQFVLRGGSCATPASHIRATYRNFFPPEARWQFSGIRLAKDA